MKSIKNLIAEEAVVICDREQQTVPAANLVAVYLVMISMGDRVPVDLRLVETLSDVKFDCSLLTGDR